MCGTIQLRITMRKLHARLGPDLQLILDVSTKTLFELLMFNDVHSV